MKDFKPMLAQVYHQQPIDWGQPVYMQAKLDGVRCIFTSDGAFSRNGKRFMNVRHIEFELQKLFIKLPGLRLDGELYNHDLISQETKTDCRGSVRGIKDGPISRI